MFCFLVMMMMMMLLLVVVLLFLVVVFLVLLLMMMTTTMTTMKSCCCCCYYYCFWCCSFVDDCDGEVVNSKDNISTLANISFVLNLYVNYCPDIFYLHTVKISKMATAGRGRGRGRGLLSRECPDDEPQRPGGGAGGDNNVGLHG